MRQVALEDIMCGIYADFRESAVVEAGLGRNVSRDSMAHGFNRLQPCVQVSQGRLGKDSLATCMSYAANSR